MARLRTSVLAIRFVIFFLVLGISELPAQQIRGRVRDARTGEYLARVRVQLAGTIYQTVTDTQGRFSEIAIPSGEYALQVSTVGYRTERQEFTIAEGESKDFDVALHPEMLRHTEVLEVTAGPYPLESALGVDLAGNELRNLASVLADDPLRAVQGLPGVTSNDDFQSQFALRGAGYHRIGAYLDGVLLHAPFHAVQGESSSASLTIFNGDTLDSVSLHPGAMPSGFADRTAGALDVRTREGDRRKLSARATASASNSAVSAEGPLGSAGRGSWLAAARKSYLQYIIERTTDEPALAFGFWDAQGKLSYDPSRKHNVSLSVVQGSSGLDREGIGTRVGLNAVVTSDFDFTLATLASRYTPHASVLLTNRVAHLRERYWNANREDSSLARGGYGEWIWHADASWVWGTANTLEFGSSVRRLRDDGFLNRYVLNPYAVRRLDEYRGNGIRAGAYAQQSWAFLSGRVQLSAGFRWDRHSVNALQAISPRASVTIHPAPATRLELVWGQYAQFPAISQFFSLNGRRGLLPERATSVQAVVEQRLDERTRLRVEVYNRQDRDLLFRPLAEPRLIEGRVFHPPLDAPIENSQRGYARGAQVFLQRRTANSFTGWVSYFYGKARLRDGVTGGTFPADYDQRHGVNVFGSYRARSTVNLSMRWMYGSGLPVPGYFQEQEGIYFLSASRNEVRLPFYQRLDFRINKAFIRDRWQLTLFAEVVNLFNRSNRRFEELRRYSAGSGRAWPGFQTMLPIIPSAGLVVEF